MLRTFLLCLSLLLLGDAVAAAAVNLGNPASQILIREGNQFELEGKFNDALQRYRAAMQADPATSVPHSLTAALFLKVAAGADPEHKKTYRDEARREAKAALAIADNDPAAQQVLLGLMEEIEPYRTSPQAEEAMRAGESAFTRKDFPLAIQHYTRAAEIDPKYAAAILYIGDAYFAMEQYGDAEKYFRKATQIDPMLTQAWRFLADTLNRLGRRADAEAAALGAIAARPSEVPSWAWLAQTRSPQGLRSFALQRGADVDVAGGKISLDPSGVGTFWMSFGISRIAQDKHLSVFGAELAAWETAFKIDAELAGKDKAVENDAGLRQMRQFFRDGNLKPALFLLLYRDAYRADFEAWKLANPGAIKRFIDQYELQPVAAK